MKDEGIEKEIEKMDHEIKNNPELVKDIEDTWNLFPIFKKKLPDIVNKWKEIIKSLKL
jgi:hypothetical protein